MSKLKIIVKDSNVHGQELIFKFGDRYQAIALNETSTKQHVVNMLHDLAENIANDILIE